MFSAAIKGYAAAFPLQDIYTVQADPAVVSVARDPEYLVVRETITEAQPEPTEAPRGVRRIRADNKTNTGRDIRVAVLDSGIDLTHPDLADNIVDGVNCSVERIDQTAAAQDITGHGTHVAGTIAAKRDGSGVVGVAPDAKLSAVRVFRLAAILGTRALATQESDVICGFNWVAERAPTEDEPNPVRVVNMSESIPMEANKPDDNNCGRTLTDLLHQAICAVRDRGVTIVVSAGNHQVNDSFHHFSDRKRPASYDEAITVTSLEDQNGLPCGAGSDDTMYSGADYAYAYDLDHVVGAPGVNITSTIIGNRYGEMTGTSFAAPHVAGVAALYIRRYMDDPANGGAAPSPSQVKTYLMDPTISEPKDQDFRGECNGGVSHRDLTGDHPEVVVRADLL